MSSRLPRGWVPPAAGRQSGLFTREQALAAGATARQIRYLRDSGRWRTVVGDALIADDRVIGPWHRAQAAALTWPDAVVCLTSAGLLHRLPVPDDGIVHVLVPCRRASRSGLVTHRLPFDRREVMRFGIATVTDLQRTLYDCIGRLPRPDAERLVTWAGTRERIDRQRLADAAAARPRAWGNVQRRQAVADLGAGAYNAAERRLQQILRRAGITGWAGDQRLDLGEIIVRADVLFRAARLVLEVDGFASHGPDRFQEDRTRQNALVAAGYTVLRFTWWDLVERPGHVAAQVRATLERLAAH